MYVDPERYYQTDATTDCGVYSDSDREIPAGFHVEYYPELDHDAVLASQLARAGFITRVNRNVRNRPIIGHWT